MGNGKPGEKVVMKTKLDLLFTLSKALFEALGVGHINDRMRSILLWNLFHRQRNGGTEKGSDLPWATELENGRTGL